MRTRFLGAVAVGVLALGCRRGAPESAAQAAVAEPPAQQVMCGKVQCPAGEVCCNPSCGICAPPQGMCTQQFCDEASPKARAGEPPPEAPKPSCERVPCTVGTHCELVEVQCIRAPCDPVPQCRPNGDAATAPAR